MVAGQRIPLPIPFEFGNFPHGGLDFGRRGHESNRNVVVVEQLELCAALIGVVGMGTEAARCQGEDRVVGPDHDPGSRIRV